MTGERWQVTGDKWYFFLWKQIPIFLVLVDRFSVYHIHDYSHVSNDLGNPAFIRDTVCASIGNLDKEPKTRKTLH